VIFGRDLAPKVTLFTLTPDWAGKTGFQLNRIMLYDIALGFLTAASEAR
jgi:hypothetical protein